MIRFFKIICAVALAMTFITAASAAAPELASESAVLMDADTGQVLYNKDMHTRRYPASITKVATAITGLENAKLTDKMVMSANAVFSVPYGSSHIALDENEEITFEQALYAALMMSANDACNGIAEHCGGTIENFVAMMNETAKKAGAKDTNFVNAHGFHDENHYTTAYDMAMIFRYALRNDIFREVIGTHRYTMPPNNEQPEKRYFINQHDMVSLPRWKYEGLIGGKPGWTSAAKNTLVTAAERDGRTLIAVVMRSTKNDYKYEDTVALFDYGFSEFDRLELTTADLPENSGYALCSPVGLLVPKGTDREEIGISTLIEGGNDYIVATFTDGTELGRVQCSAEIDVSAKSAAEIAAERLRALLIIVFIISVIIATAVFIIVARKKRRF